MGADATVDQLAIEIEANAAQSVNGVKSLSRALTSLSKSITKVNSAGINNVSANLKIISTATQTAGNSADNASSGTNKYSSSLASLISNSDKAGKSTKSLAYYFGKMYANCWIAIRGFKALGNAANSAMDYIEAFNFYDVSINSATAKTGEWATLGYDSAKSYADAFKQGLADFNEKMSGFKTDVNTGDITPTNLANLGINITGLDTFQAEIVSITSSLGLMTKTSYDTAKGLSMLTADMSSLHNIDLDTVMKNFQSGLIGQSRSLYKYGIDITNATLQEKAYANGITKSVSEMTQAEKMQLRMIAILDQSKVAWGDLANTINQPANQLRVFQNGIKNLAITIGKVLLPIVSGVLPYLNAMVKALQTLFAWIASIADINFDASNAGSATSDVFDGIEDSAEDATDAVNSLKKSLTTLGIDELNINNPSSSSGGSGVSGGGIDLSDAIDSALANYEKAWDEAYANMTDRATEMADAIVDAFKRKDYKGIGTYISTGITNALNGINWNTVYSVSSEFGKGFAEFLNGLITPDLFSAVGKTIANSLNTALYNALSFGETFDWNNLGESIGDGVNSFFENFDFKSLGKTLNTWAQGIMKAIRKALQTISWKDVWDGVTDFLGELDVDTVAIIIGAFSLKYAGKILTSSAMKDAIFGLFNEKLAAAFGTSSLLGTAASTAATGFAIAATIYVGFKFAEDAETWWNNIQKYGWDEGRKITANENTANPYKNGNALVQDDGTGPFDSWLKKLEDWQKKNREARASEQEEFDIWYDNMSKSVSDWYTNDIEPWFSEETWKNLGNNIKESLTTKWEEFQEWWENTGIYNWWNTDVVPWFSKEKWIEVSNGMKTGLTDKWNEFSSWWKNTGIYKWWNDNVSPYFTKEKWTFSGIKSGLEQAFNNAIEGIKQIWNRFANWLNEKLVISWDGFKLPNGDEILGGSIRLGHIPTFMNGGITSADIFAANENGIPELVGTIGGKSAVASGTEITGIKDALYDTSQEEMQLMREEISLLRQIVSKDFGTYIGDRDIARAAERGKRSMGMELRTT